MKRFVLIVITLILLTTSACAATSVKTDLKWAVDQYVDEFGRKTSDKIVHNTELVYGTFSNSVAKNATLGVFIVADKNDIYLLMYEYGRSMVTNPLSRQNYMYDVSILDANNKKHTLKGAIPPSDYRLYFDNNNTVINALKSGSISMAITKSDRKVQRYNFTIDDTKDFGKLYDQTFPKKKKK